MNKYQQATTFYHHYVRLSDSKKEEFSRLCNKLLSYNYICASRPKDQDDYYKIVSELDLYVQYFALMDYVVEHHQVDKVINLYNLQNYNHFKNLEDELIKHDFTDCEIKKIFYKNANKFTKKNIS